MLPDPLPKVIGQSRPFLDGPIRAPHPETWNPEKSNKFCMQLELSQISSGSLYMLFFLGGLGLQKAKQWRENEPEPQREAEIQAGGTS